MSHSTSPTKSSLFGWVNKLKRNSTSVDELLLDDQLRQLLPHRSQPIPITSSPRGSNPDLHPQMSPLSYINALRSGPQPIPISSSGHHQQNHTAGSPVPLHSPTNQNINSSTSNLSVASSPNQLAAGSTPMVVSSPSHLTLSHHSDFLRPLLHHKSRSSNNVHPSHAPHGSTLLGARDRARSNSNVSLKQSIDSFVALNYHDENSKYFGVPLEDAINQAAAKISILAGAGSGADTDSNGIQYGKIPIVVAKCGVFLKKKGLTVEGIFRVGGSSKRIKELQSIFNSPPDFGKKLSWEGYNVHDAASILRRYLNALPEPLIPLAFYQEFRMPLLNRPRVINYLKFKAENPKRTPSTSSPTKGGTSKPSGVSGSSDFSHGHNTTQHSPNSLPSNNAAGSSLPSETLSDRDYRLEKALENEVIESMIPKSPHLTSITSKEAPILPNLDQIAGSSTQAHSNSKAMDRSMTTTPDSANSKDSTPKPTEGGSKHSRSLLHQKRKYKKLTKDVHDAIDDYTHLVEQLPILSKQLLFYILDLLAMVQNHSSENRMPSRNLAAIFQPSILSHPNHDMDPEEYALSQYVVEFLIQYAYRLLPNEEHKKVPPKESIPLEAPNPIVPTSSAQTAETFVPLITFGGAEDPGTTTEVTTPNRKPKAPTSVIPKTPSDDQSVDSLTPEKVILSDTTKADAPSTLAVSKTPASYRPHSKSLPVNSNDEDLVVYQTPSALPSERNVIDSDIGMTDDSSDDEGEGNPSSPHDVAQKLSDMKLSKSEPLADKDQDQELLENEFDFGEPTDDIVGNDDTKPTRDVTKKVVDTSVHPSPTLDDNQEPECEILESTTPPIKNGGDAGINNSPQIIVSEFSKD